jgi:tRNA-specific 2-thiouridylase
MKIAVALSGGIDSASTALQFKQAGHDVFGLTMFLFDHQEKELSAAKEVAAEIGIAHHIIDYRDAFEQQVISPFISAYESGETPNPCLYCNKSLKYGKLLEQALALGADKFATGHYAKVLYDETTKTYAIARAVNTRKDQSYNLYQLTQHELKHLILPLGTVPSKEMLRSFFATYHKTHTDKKESQGICFIKRGGPSHFLKSRGSSASQKGLFISEDGTILGWHKGISGYTLGQKKGIDIHHEASHVVTGIDGKRNTVMLGQEASLYTDVLHMTTFNFLSPTIKKMASTKAIAVRVKTSQWSPFYEGSLSVVCEHTPHVTLHLKTPARAVTPGQAIVCYQGDILIGGGKFQKR